MRYDAIHNKRCDEFEAINAMRIGIRFDADDTIIMKEQFIRQNTSKIQNTVISRDLYYNYPTHYLHDVIIHEIEQAYKIFI